MTQPTTPDMTKEFRKELRTLKALDRALVKEGKSHHRFCAKAVAQVKKQAARDIARIEREARNFASGTAKRLAATAKRIAILEGRLS